MKGLTAWITAVVMLCFSTFGYAQDISALVAKAQSNDAEAQYELGEYYLDQHDYAQAVVWYEKAANQGGDDINLKACAMTGELYLGYGDVEEDVQRAEIYLEVAAKGDIPEAQYNLGWLHANGKLRGEIDNKRARYWYTQAAENNYAPALFSLGLLHLRGGHGIEVNYTEAKKWFEAAAAEGDSRAEHNIATMYYNGEGGPRNYKKAKQWYEKAAEHGQPESMQAVGGIYQDGLGVKRNRSKARAYFKQACDAGLDDACNAH